MKKSSGKVLLLIATVIATVIGLSFLGPNASARLDNPSSTPAPTPCESPTPSKPAGTLGSPHFTNPCEVRSKPAEKKLRAVIELINGKYDIPNVGRQQLLRQFHGWDAAEPRPTPKTSIGPGPTLRARIGDHIQVAFLNKVHEDSFPYTFVTGKDKPPFSGAGCDQVGLPDAQGKYQYPASDKYPNCFHGSSTANIHYHGTHTSPDGLGDNVLVQVLPDPAQPDWTSSFNKIFNSSTIPQKWEDLPVEFRNAQLDLVGKRDDKQKAEAIANGLRAPE